MKSVWPTPRMNATIDGAEGRALRRKHDVRRLRRDLVNAGLVAQLQHLGRDRGDRDRRVLQVLLAELRRDDDFFKLVFAIVFGPRYARVRRTAARIANTLAATLSAGTLLLIFTYEPSHGTCCCFNTHGGQCTAPLWTRD